MKKSAILLTAAGVVGGALTVAGLSAALAGWGIASRKARQAWGAALRGQVVLITGGSRGLGLQLAREFAAQGCKVAICARHAEQLEAARADLRGRGADTLIVQCDVTDRSQVEALVQKVTEHFGRIDILVNNAGSIRVGPFDSMRPEDFEDAMALMFWGPVHTTLAVLPQMRARGSGRIVNITSIGGKVSVPHLLPYSCAKFAAVAFSEGLRTEVGRDGVQVTTIVPGLMRTGSHLNAEFKGKHTHEFRWFSLAASSALTATSAERAARDIVQAARWGLPVRILSVPANLLARLHGVLPEFTIPVMTLVSEALLPQGSDPRIATGAQAEKELDSRLLRIFNTLGRTAAQDLNQSPVETLS